MDTNRLDEIKNTYEEQIKVLEDRIKELESDSHVKYLHDGIKENIDYINRLENEIRCDNEFEIRYKDLSCPVCTNIFHEDSYYDRIYDYRKHEVLTGKLKCDACGTEMIITKYGDRSIPSGYEPMLKRDLLREFQLMAQDCQNMTENFERIHHDLWKLTHG